MTPLPCFANWEAFNAYLEEQGRKRQGEVLRGHAKTIGERLEQDLETLTALPPIPFGACDKVATQVTSLSLVRYRSNDYSVPVAFGHQDVWVRGHVHQVVIGCGAEIIARHRRSYDREDLVFDPIHYPRPIQLGDHIDAKTYANAENCTRQKWRIEIAHDHGQS